MFMRRATWAVLAVSAGFGGVASGCSTGDALGQDGARVVVAGPADGGDDAQVAGEVRLVDGCLGIDDAVALWPSGTDIVGDDPLTIEVPGVGELQVGDSVRGAGGYTEPGRYDGKPSLPESCSKAPVVFFRSQ